MCDQFLILLIAHTNILIVVSEKKTNIGTFKLGQVRFSKPRNKLISRFARLILSGRESSHLVHPLFKFGA